MTTYRRADPVPAPKDLIDQICEQLEKGIPVNKFNVVGHVTVIIERLQQRGTYSLHFDNLLWELHDAAKEIINEPHI